MKIYRNSSILMILLVSILTFTSCNDDKKEKEAMEKEKTEMANKEKADNDMKMEAERKEEAMKMEARSNSIAVKAMDNAELKTFTAALKAAELDMMLSEPGNYTTFAPTEHAFSKLPKGTVENLLKPENKEQLKSVLQYHVVQGKIMSNELAAAIKGGKGKYTFNTVTGGKLTAMMDGDQFVIQDETGKKAHIVLGNVDASNGIAYLIDTVLMAKKK